MSSPKLCQWIQAYRKGLGAFPGIDCYAFSPGPISVDDVPNDAGQGGKGVGYCSFQLNVRGDAFGYQVVLKPQPDRIMANFTCFDGAGKQVSDLDFDTMTNLNIDDLADTRIHLGFLCNPLNEIVIEVKDANGYILNKAGYSIPAAFASNIKTAYFDAAGWGDCSKANFGALGLYVQLISQGIDDMAAAQFPESSVPTGLNVLGTCEGSNTAQQLSALTPNLVSMQAIIGSGLPT